MQKIKNVFLIADLRSKILFTLFIIAVYRAGSFITVPGVNFGAVQQLSNSTGNGGAFGVVSLFSGGALVHFSIFSLGIMPYITASIIIQLMQVVIPKLAQWRDEGATGQKKINQTTRYLTVVLALMQATGIAYALNDANTRKTLGISLPDSVNVFNHFDGNTVLLFVFSIVVGTLIVMWLGELITQRGIGQGMSIIIFANVVSRLPGDGAQIFSSAKGDFKWVGITAMLLFIIFAIILVEQGQRRIPVQYAKRIVGRRMTAATSTYIPMKVNPSGVVPIIFATSVLQFPTLLATVLGGWGPTQGTSKFISDHLLFSQNLDYSWSSAFVLGALIVGFAYFYNQIQFDPYQQADQLKKQGAYVPGVRPGYETESHIRYILNRITLPGALFVAFIALLPTFMLPLFGITNFPLSGTTLLIAVGVSLDTMKQIDSQLLTRNYEGFLKS